MRQVLGAGAPETAVRAMPWVASVRRTPGAGILLTLAAMACSSKPGASPDAGFPVGTASDAEGVSMSPAPGCPTTVAAYCSQDACVQTWPLAPTLACTARCAGGVFVYSCDGVNVANCPGDEGGGETWYFDPASQALLAIVMYPSIEPGGAPGCFVGPESLRYLSDSGPPSCPPGPLLACGQSPVDGGASPSLDANTYAATNASD